MSTFHEISQNFAKSAKPLPGGPGPGPLRTPFYLYTVRETGVASKNTPREMCVWVIFWISEGPEGTPGIAETLHFLVFLSISGQISSPLPGLPASQMGDNVSQLIPNGLRPNTFFSSYVKLFFILR